MSYSFMRKNSTDAYLERALLRLPRVKTSLESQ